MSALVCEVFPTLNHRSYRESFMLYKIQQIFQNRLSFRTEVERSTIKKNLRQTSTNLGKDVQTHLNCYKILLDCQKSMVCAFILKSENSLLFQKCISGSGVQSKKVLKYISILPFQMRTSIEFHGEKKQKNQFKICCI